MQAAAAGDPGNSGSGSSVTHSAHLSTSLWGPCHLTCCVSAYSLVPHGTAEGVNSCPAAVAASPSSCRCTTMCASCSHAWTSATRRPPRKRPRWQAAVC